MVKFTKKKQEIDDSKEKSDKTEKVLEENFIKARNSYDNYKNVYYTTNQVEYYFRSFGKLEPLKIELLMYYAYVWSLVYFNEGGEIVNVLFDDDYFVVHPEGPMLERIYNDHQDECEIIRNRRFFKRYPKKLPEIINFKLENCKFNKYVEEEEYNKVDAILEAVWNYYGNLDVNTLYNKVTSEKPYVNACKKVIENEDEQFYPFIKDEDICDFYGNILNLPFVLYVP